MDLNSTVVGESQIFRGNKTVLFEQEWGEENEKMRHIALLFDCNGNGEVVGLFNEFKQQMVEQLNKYKRV